MMTDRNGNKLNPGDAVEVMATVDSEIGDSLMVYVKPGERVEVPRDAVRIARGSLNDVQGVLEGGRR